MSDNTQKFTGKSALYHMGRPDYPNALFDIFKQYGLKKTSVVADIGAGTGIFSRQLIENGYDTISIEPNPDMYDQLKQNMAPTGRACLLNMSAEETGLLPHSVHFITVAQAFHWFDIPRFKKECLRICRKKSAIALFWNVHDLFPEQNLLNHRFCPNFKGKSGGCCPDERVAQMELPFQKYEIDYPLSFSREKYVIFCLSSSYALSTSDKNYQRYVWGLEKIAADHEKNGGITLPNKTILFISQMHPSNRERG